MSSTCLPGLPLLVLSCFKLLKALSTRSPVGKITNNTMVLTHPVLAMALQIICSILVCCSCQACRAVLVNRTHASLRQDSLPVFSLNKCWASSAACNSFQATVQSTTSKSKPRKLMLEAKISAKVTVLPACTVFQRHQKTSATGSSRKCSSGIRSCCSTD